MLVQKPTPVVPPWCPRLLHGAKTLSSVLNCRHVKIYLSHLGLKRFFHCAMHPHSPRCVSMYKVKLVSLHWYHTCGLIPQCGISHYVGEKLDEVQWSSCKTYNEQCIVKCIVKLASHYNGGEKLDEVQRSLLCTMYS